MVPAAVKTGAETQRIGISFFHVLIVSAAFSALFIAGSANAQGGSSAFRLIGTVLAGRFSGAVIDVGKEGQTFFQLHEKLPDGSEIIKVRDDSITVKQADGAAYDLYINHDTKVASTGASGMGVTPAMIRNKPAGGGSTPHTRRRLRRLSGQKE